jgi:hypothetical protein
VEAGKVQFAAAPFQAVNRDNLETRHQLVEHQGEVGSNKPGSAGNQQPREIHEEACDFCNASFFQSLAGKTPV